jgi:DNA polymerase-3 subunit gamma/tau
MAYQVLARKYRPQFFSDVAGQDHVTRTLMNALEQNRIAHGYIFSGHRGIGKTTIARIVAMALNCRTAIGTAERPTPEPCAVCDSCVEIRQGNAVDVIEIDAATNRGIDEIRELRDAARYAPARDRYKIHILDEAHQITEAAFNALLKTLEEPPPHVIFMMATTEPENIPQTIRSRCQHFSLHAVKYDDILAQLKMIAEKEGIGAENEALAMLAEAGDGSMRDALSIMDQAIASAPMEAGRPMLSAAQIRDLTGAVPNAVFERLLETVAQGESAALMEQLNGLLNAGHSPLTLARQMVKYLRNALMAKLGGAQTELLQISGDERERAARTAMLYSEEELTRNLQIVLRTFDDLNYRQEQRFHLELGMLKLIHAQRLLPIEELLSGAAGGVGARGSAGAGAGAGPGAGRATTGPMAVAPRTAPVAEAKPAGAFVSPFGTSDPFGAGGPFGASSPSGAGGGMGLRTEAKPAGRTEAAVEPALRTTRTTMETGGQAAAAPVASAVAVAVSEDAGETAGDVGLSGFAKTGVAVASAVETAVLETAAAETESAAAPAAARGAVDVDAVRRAITAALEDGGHSSAAVLLEAGTLSVAGTTVYIEVGLGKKMIGLTFNAAAEKIIRQELQRLGAPTRFLIQTGKTNGDGRVAAPTTPRTGSVQEMALAHPLVKHAQEIFKADVRSVIDLRAK